jgi:preprotein translocase subunit SecE
VAAGSRQLPVAGISTVKTSTIDATKGSNRRPPPARTGGEDGGEGLLSRPTAWWDRARTFIEEVRGEMRRVTWPGRREVYATTVVVVLVSVFFGVYLWVVDLALASVVRWLIAQVGTA